MNRVRVGFYQQQIQDFQNQLTNLKKQHAIASVARLIVFISICLSFSWLLVIHLTMGYSIWNIAARCFPDFNKIPPKD